MSRKPFRILRRYAVAPIMTIGLAIALLAALIDVAEAAPVPLSDTHQIIAWEADYFPKLLVMRSGDRIRICNKDPIFHRPAYYLGTRLVKLGPLRPGSCVTTHRIFLQSGAKRGSLSLHSEVYTNAVMYMEVYRVNPGPEGACRMYALTAVAQQDMNVARRHREHMSYQCGYTGRRWSTNYNGHLNWCLDATPAARTRETKKREAALSKCTENNWTFRRLTYLSFVGDWVCKKHCPARSGGEGKIATIRVKGIGELIITNEGKETSTGKLDEKKRIIAKDWGGLAGTLSEDGNIIVWTNKTKWVRR